MHRSAIISVVILSIHILQFCSALQNNTINGKCNFYVIMKETESFQCFEKMNGPDSKCSSSHSTPTCNTHHKDGTWCIKWPTNIDLACWDDREHIHILDGKKCASDQNSIRCEGEYKDDGLKNCVSALSISFPWIVVLIPAILFTLH